MTETEELGGTMIATAESGSSMTTLNIRYFLWGLAAALAVLAVGWHVVTRIREVEAPVSPISYQQIEAVFDGSRDLTDAQRRDFLDNLRGAKVRWTGVVEEVDENYVVFVDIDGLFYDVRFTLPPEAAVKINRGQEITFVGLIAEVESFMWRSCRVVLRDVAVE